MAAWQTFLRLGRVGSLADFLLRIIAAALLFAMMALTLVDVVMRYGFNDSIHGAFEITELLLVVLIFAGIPLVSHNDQHVAVDLLDSQLPDGLKRVLAIFTQVLCAVVMAGISWMLWRKLGRAVDDHDVTSALHIPIPPFVFVMFVLTTVTTVVHLWKLVSMAMGRKSTAPRPALREPL